MSSINSLSDRISQGLVSLKSSIINLGNSIVNGFQNLLISLFVPSDNLFGELEVMFNNKFGIFNQIKELVDAITFQNDTEPPEFNIVLYGKKYKFIDLSFYSQYRLYIHSIILCISYYQFVLWIYTSAPAIIGGFGSPTPKEQYFRIYNIYKE